MIKKGEGDNRMIWPFNKLKYCKHTFDMADAINIENHLEAYTEVNFNPEKYYKRNLADWRIICPCWKCGAVFHASCGLDLPGSIGQKGEWKYVSQKVEAE